jgi:hypothetical protein
MVGARKPTRIAIMFVSLFVFSTWMLASSRFSFTDDDPPQYSDWWVPVSLGPIVNWPGKSDQQPAISKDGLSLYFSSGRPGAVGGAGDIDIYVSQRASVNDPWGPPQNLGPNVNSTSWEFGPALSPDEHRLYFSSQRPEGMGGNDIYVSRRHNKRDDFTWRAAENLGNVVNTSSDDSNPDVFEDDLSGAITLYFQSDRPGGLGGADIWASNLQPDETFGPPVLIVELSSSFADLGSDIRRDGLEMFLASNRPGTYGGQDLWVSTRPSTSDPWSTPVNLGPVVNSAAAENTPALSFDGTQLYFTSTLLGGPAPQDLWVSTRTKLGHEHDGDCDDDEHGRPRSHRKQGRE